MSKRFADTEIWNKDWYLDLTLKGKLLLKFLFDNCDCAGVYEISYRNLKNCFGEEITKDDFLGIKQIRFLENGKIFIEDFIQFQYGVSISNLNPEKNVHKGILKSLNKNGVLPTLAQPLGNSYPTVLVKDMVMDKVKDMDNIINANFEKIDIWCDTRLEKCFNLYKEHCKNLLPIQFEARDKEVRQKTADFLNVTNCNFDYLITVLKKADKLISVGSSKLDYKMVINNHDGIYKDKYQNVSTSKKGVSDNKLNELFKGATG